jgi:hypothetical protein
MYNLSDIFDPRDVQRLLTDDYYMHRFYMHVFEVSGDQGRDSPILLNS